MKFLLWLSALAALSILPAALQSDFYINICSQILIAALIASSLNLLVGYAGLTSLGHAAFAGTAAYAIVWLSIAGVGPAAAVGIALLCVGVMAAVFGYLALRATGLGFLMITLALGQVLWGVAYRYVDLTGGDNGLSLPGRPDVFGFDIGTPAAFYYLTLVVFLLVLIALVAFVRSPLGLSIQGTRDQPRRMRALGYNVWLIQWLVFIAAGLLGGVGGVLYAYYHQYINPQFLALTNSAEYLLMVIAGGSGSIAGPVVGAAVVVLAKTVVSAYVARWLMLLGIVFVLIVLFMPEGMVPGLARLAKAIRARLS
ncbi:MAG: branched-chain amino acid ABC transporter permease [Mesorhizobium sp.]|uniref:branched-chain amino acid ABC transporter permease n=1 Tax=Mesorhizobium sp. TaxID=1871066 RepID=UPI000FEA998E|nr:branched-chain amino acid ABC transporter permease [Mesorhizobium sp.]RWI50258.1 MAG: branched-chain amino acid ABC transporter permease [Mesorhizobium sp.]